MEDFEIKAINSARNPPKVWEKYVDDTFVVLRSADEDRLLEHINSTDLHIQFIAEDTRSNFPIVCAVLELDSWNYSPGEQEPTA